MEKYISTASSASSFGWNFYSFLKYFVPGFFAAFWVVLYAMRLAHPLGTAEPIATDAQLLTFLSKRWAETIGMVLALGGFIGFVLSGVDPIIRAFMGSRVLDFVFKYLLSSKPVDFAYFQFMRLHNVSYRYERLPKHMVRRLGLGLEKFSYVNDENGDYARKYFFRESVQNYFWQRRLSKEDRTELEKEWDQASLFLYLSFVSLLLLVFQTFLYIENIASLTMAQGSILWLESYLPPILFNWFNRFSIFDFVPLVLAVYIIATLFYNVCRRLVQGPEESDSNKRNWRPKRLMMQFVAIVGYLAFCVAFHSKISAITWLEPTDIFLFSFFFLTFVAFYWSGAFHFSRYVINFEHLFREHEPAIVSFIRRNSDLIIEMDKDLGRTPKRSGTKGDQNPASTQAISPCKNCCSRSEVTYFCQKCGNLLCYHCAAHEAFKCPDCGTQMQKAQLDSLN